MIQITCSKGAEVDGVRLDEQIEAKLMGGLTDDEKVAAVIQFLKLRMVSAVQTVDGGTVQDALSYVEDHVTIQT